jgi:DNA primase
MITDLDWKARADRFVETLKDKADLIDVMQQKSRLTFERKSGRFTYCKEHDSLAVDENWGQYTWFSKAGSAGQQYETGDVFTWLERYENMDFWEACVWLAEKYGVDVPVGMKGDGAQAKEMKSRGQAFEIAARWFEHQLWNTPAALEYAKGRGWSEETMRAARLGFSGGTAAGVKDLAGTFSMNEVNCDDPATVSLIGRRGNVAAWLKDWNIQNASESWTENDSIVGLATFPRLVYPHIWRGRVNYFTGRNLQWQDGQLVGQDVPKEGKPKAHNLPASLVGERLRFFNAEFHRGAEICFVVEGQGDAITLAQWGFAAVALVGVAADEGLAALLKQMKVKTLYVALDDDKAGQEALMKTAGVFGPMARLFKWQIQNTEADNDESI